MGMWLRFKQLSRSDAYKDEEHFNVLVKLDDTCQPKKIRRSSAHKLKEYVLEFRKAVPDFSHLSWLVLGTLENTFHGTGTNS